MTPFPLPNPAPVPDPAQVRASQQGALDALAGVVQQVYSGTADQLAGQVQALAPTVGRLSQSVQVRLGQAASAVAPILGSAAAAVPEGLAAQLAAIQPFVGVERPSQVAAAQAGAAGAPPPAPPPQGAGQAPFVTVPPLGRSGQVVCQVWQPPDLAQPPQVIQVGTSAQQSDLVQRGWRPATQQVWLHCADAQAWLDAALVPPPVPAPGPPVAPPGPPAAPGQPLAPPAAPAAPAGQPGVPACDGFAPVTPGVGPIGAVWVSAAPGYPALGGQRVPLQAGGAADPAWSTSIEMHSAEPYPTAELSGHLWCGAGPCGPATVWFIGDVVLPDGSRWSWGPSCPHNTQTCDSANSSVTLIPAGSDALVTLSYTPGLLCPAAPAPAAAAPAPGAACPLPPGAQPEPPPSPPGPIRFDCILMAGDFGLPSPGSEDWCKAVERVVKAWSQASDKLFETIDGLLDPTRNQKELDDYVKQGSRTNPLGYVADAFVWLAKKLFGLVEPIFTWIRDQIRCMRQWMSVTFASCNVPALSALIAARIVLRTLRHIEWGTDAALWATAVSDIEFPPLENTLDYLIEYVCPQEMPSPEVALKAYNRGLIPEELVKCIWQAHSRDWAAWAPYRTAESEQISGHEAIEYVRRQDGDYEAEKAWLKKVGWTDPEQVAATQELYWELPSISDHLHWLQRNVFDKDYVRDFHLMEGFEERFWPAFGPDLTRLGMRKLYAEHHYAAHWVVPATGQLFEMTQRLRPDKVGPELQFTTQDLLRILVEQDVAPYFRPRLEAISHPAPSLSIILQLYQSGQVDFTKLRSMVLDLGYSESDTDLILAGRAIQVRRMNASAGKGWTPAALASAYRDGLMDADRVRQEMVALGYADRETDQLLERAGMELRELVISSQRRAVIGASIRTAHAAYRCGTLGTDAYVKTLGEIGVDERTARASASQIDAQMRVEECEAGLKLLQRNVRQGLITLVEAADAMRASGMPEERVVHYREVWARTLTPTGGARTASRILRYVREGLLDAASAGQRLTNLGWTEADILLALAEVQQQVGTAQARQLAAAQHSAQKQEHAAAQAVKAAQKAVKDSQAILRRLASPAKLQKWLKLGIVDEELVRARLAALGYDPADIDRYIREAQEKAPAKKSAKGKGGAPPKGGPPASGS